MRSNLYIRLTRTNNGWSCEVDGATALHQVHEDRSGPFILELDDEDGHTWRLQLTDEGEPAGPRPI